MLQEQHKKLQKYDDNIGKQARCVLSLQNPRGHAKDAAADVQTGEHGGVSLAGPQFVELPDLGEEAQRKRYGGQDNAKCLYISSQYKNYFINKSSLYFVVIVYHRQGGRNLGAKEIQCA